MSRRVIFITLAGLFLLGSLNFVEAQPQIDRRARPKVEVQPQIDQRARPKIDLDKKIDLDIRPKVPIPDDPQIEEFSVNPTSVLQGGQVTFRWRVTPGPGGSPITTIRINIGATVVHSSSSSNGSYVFNFLPIVGPGTWTCTLTATNQIGRSAQRTVNVNVIADDPIIRIFTFSLPQPRETNPYAKPGGWIRFSWSVGPTAGGSPIRMVTISLDGRTLHSTPNMGGEYRYDIPADINIGRKVFTLEAVNQAGRRATETLNVEIADYPVILEASATPTTVVSGGGGHVTFRWRVEPARGGSAINRVLLVFEHGGRIELHSSSSQSGEFRYNIPTIGSIAEWTLSYRRLPIVLYATNRAGITSHRSINLAVVPDTPIIREFSVTPARVPQRGQITFRWTVETPPGGSPITEVKIIGRDATMRITEIRRSLSTSGEYVFTLPHDIGLGRRTFSLNVTNRRGISEFRNVDIEVVLP